MDIGTLTGQVALEDQMTEQLSELTGKVKEFAKGFVDELGPVGTALGAATIAVSTLTAAIAGLTITVQELGEKGSVINGVTDAFDRLSESVGTSGDALREGFSKGLQGTVSDMTIMQDTTRLLGSGMKLTTDQATLMGQAARELGKATGTDAAAGLETLSSALTTGRTRQLQMQIGLIDTKRGEEEFAASIGTTADQLNAEGQLEGKRMAILEAVQGYLDRIGTSQLTFKERWQQAETAVEEWFASLAKAVASSPEVMNAVNAIGDSLKKAFGADTQSFQDLIIKGINEFARVVQTWAPIIIEQIGHIVDTIKNAYQGAKDFALIYALLNPGNLAIASALTGGITNSPGYGKDVNLPLTNQTPPKDDPTGSGQYLKDRSETSRKLADKYDFTDITKQAKDLADAFELIEAQGKATPDVIMNVVKAEQKMLEEGAILTPQMADLVIKLGDWKAKLVSLHTAIDEFAHKVPEMTLPLQSQLALYERTMDDMMLKPIGLFGTNITQQFHEQSGKLIQDIESIVKATEDLNRAIQVFGGTMGGPLGDAIKLFGSLSATMEQAYTSFNKAQQFLTQGNATAALKEQIAGWVQLGTAVLSAGEAIMATHTKMQGLLTGMASGASIGSMFGPWGAAIGAGIGGITGVIKNLFGGGEGRDMVVNFANSFGGFDELHAKLQTLGADGEKLWITLTQGVKGNDTAAAQKAIQAVTDAFNKQASSIASIQQQIAALGGSGVPDLQAITKAAQTLGITTDKLGQTFQDATAAANWQAVIDSMDVLQRSGMDVGAIVDLSSDKLNKMYQDAVKFGTTLPANAQPWLDQLAAEGRLFDANGQKITQAQVDGMNWGDSMQTTIQKLTDALNKLTGVIAGPSNSVKSAFESLGGVVVSPKVKPIYDGSNLPGDYSGRWNPDSSTPTGGGASASYAAPSTSAITVPVNLVVGNEVMARQMVKTFVQAGF